MRQNDKYPDKIAIILLGIIAIFACTRNPSNNTALSTSAVIDTTSYTLPLPVIPSSLSSPEERAGFLSTHYWDRMDWNDTLLLSSERFMGESMATFGQLLHMTSHDKAVASVIRMVNGAAVSERALNTVNKFAYQYFYYPDAPQHDAETYLLFINALLAQPGIDYASRVRLEERLSQINKNRVNQLASDFKYIGTDGNMHSMISTRSDADIRILMFYDPDCTVCDEAAKILSSGHSFNLAQQEGQVAVIAINADGQEEGGPAKVKKGFQPSWTVGYSPDGEVNEDEIYVIRATPSIYIIDKQGTILEKDLSLRRLAEIVGR